MSDQQPASKPEAQPNTETNVLKKEIESLKQQAEEYLNGWKRTKADYENLQKEHDRHQIEFIQFANSGLILELLPLVEHFKQAFRHLPEELKNSDWVKGIEHIQAHLNHILASQGVAEIPTVGQKFDPSRHEAVEEIKNDQPAGTIVEEVRAGFSLHGRVIQAARVKVAQ